MTAHIALPNVDPVKRPSTLSPVMMTEILRGSLGFNGVVVTDGMTMQGVTDSNTPDEAAVKAIEAGIDVVLVPEDLAKAYTGVLHAVKSGRISAQRLDQSVCDPVHAGALRQRRHRRGVSTERLPPRRQ